MTRLACKLNSRARGRKGKRKVAHIFAAGSMAVGLTISSALPSYATDELQQIKAKGTITIGVKTDYPPFGFRAPNGDVSGIEPDLARDLAQRLDVKVEFVPVVAANRIQFLQQGKIDVLMATLGVTADRAKQLQFVEPYYYASGYNLMLLKTLKVKAWTAVKGMQICAIQGAFYNKSASETYGIELVAFRGVAEAMTAMQQGRCVGLLFDDTGIVDQLKAPQWRDYEMALPSQDLQPWGIGVRLESPELKDAVSNAIKDWAKRGAILALEDKYGMPQHSQAAEELHSKYK